MKSLKQMGGGLTSWENIKNAWMEFALDKTKKPDVIAFKKNLKHHLNFIQKELQNKTYSHGSYETFYVKDPKLRKINKACVRDRVVHRALFRKLYPVFDKIFIYDSYSCRIGKGTHRAVRRLHEFFQKESNNNTKNCFVLKCDVKKFFENIDRDMLLGFISRRVKDKHALWLAEVIIKSFLSGLPLGNITSQLFANVYLNELDHFIKQTLRVTYYIRYCDDFVILSEDKKYLEGLIPKIDDFLRTRLKMSLHPNKVTISKYRQGVDFLGYVSFPYFTVVRVKTKKRMFKRVKSRLIDFRSGLIKKESLEATLLSYLGMLKHCNAFLVKQELLELIASFGLPGIDKLCK